MKRTHFIHMPPAGGLRDAELRIPRWWMGDKKNTQEKQEEGRKGATEEHRRKGKQQQQPKGNLKTSLGQQR